MGDDASLLAKLGRNGERAGRYGDGGGRGWVEEMHALRGGIYGVFVLGECVIGCRRSDRSE